MLLTGHGHWSIYLIIIWWSDNSCIQQIIGYTRKVKPCFGSVSLTKICMKLVFFKLCSVSLFVVVLPCTYSIQRDAVILTYMFKLNPDSLGSNGFCNIWRCVAILLFATLDLIWLNCHWSLIDTDTACFSLMLPCSVSPIIFTYLCIINS